MPIFFGWNICWFIFATFLFLRCFQFWTLTITIWLGVDKSRVQLSLFTMNCKALERHEHQNRFAWRRFFFCFIHLHHVAIVVFYLQFFLCESQVHRTLLCVWFVQNKRCFRSIAMKCNSLLTGMRKWFLRRWGKTLEYGTLFCLLIFLLIFFLWWLTLELIVYFFDLFFNYCFLTFELWLSWHVIYGRTHKVTNHFGAQNIHCSFNDALDVGGGLIVD